MDLWDLEDLSQFNDLEVLICSDATPVLIYIRKMMIEAKIMYYKYSFLQQ